MNVKKGSQIMNEAINSGCKTMRELALYMRLKAEPKVQRGCQA